MHSGRGHFLSAVTPATSALPTGSGLPAPGKSAFTARAGMAQGGGAENCGGCRVCLRMYDCVKLEQQLCRGECLQNFPERQRKKERKSFSRDEILGSLEAQGTAGALLPPSALLPSSFSSLSYLLHFLSCFPASYCLVFCKILQVVIFMS